MENFQIYFYVVNLVCLDDFDQIRITLDNDTNVHYWHFDQSGSDNKLIMVGSNLDDIVDWMKINGYISQMDEIY